MWAIDGYTLGDMLYDLQLIIDVIFDHNLA